jgi:tRNA threonylcarbamoyladenosine biosynthesis protein TsaB
MISRSTVLAIETAIGGGSISIVKNGGASIGSIEGASRAEAVLKQLDDLLAGCQIKLCDVDTIAVSLGPGSFTGIRIGLATALGIKFSTGAACVGVNALEAVALSSSKQNTISVLPLGRGNYAVQPFSSAGPGGEPNVISESELIRLTADRSDLRIYRANPLNKAGDEPLSTLIGRAALEGKGTEALAPIYLRSQPG